MATRRAEDRNRYIERRNQSKDKVTEAKQRSWEEFRKEINDNYDRTNDIVREEEKRNWRHI